MKIFNRTNLRWLAFIVIIFVLLQIGVSTGMISLVMQQSIISILINMILAVGLNLIVGFSGQLSLGHAGFMAIGAYATAVMTSQAPDYPTLFLSIIVGMVIAGLVAFIVGYPILRLKGDYLAIATLGVGEIIRVAILNMPEITNGAAGLSGIPLFLMNWQIAFVLAVIVVIFISNFVRSSHGRATIGVREDDIATQSLGINLTKQKVISFVVGAMSGALAGSIHATYLGVINPGQFTFDKSIDILIIVVFGGIGSVTGSVVAAIVLGIINLYLQQFGAIRMLLYAAVLIGIMIFKPSGLLGNFELSFSKIFKRPQDTPGYVENETEANNDQEGTA